MTAVSWGNDILSASWVMECLFVPQMLKLSIDLHRRPPKHLHMQRKPVDQAVLLLQLRGGQARYQIMELQREKV